MADISLDLKSSDISTTDYKDLLIIDGDLVLTKDVDSRGTDPVLQDLLQRMRFFLGEWFLDNSQGLPWFQQILVKNPEQSKIDAIFINVILGTPGVVQLLEYDFTPNFSNRSLKVKFKARKTKGEIIYSGILAPVTGGT